MWRPEVNRSLGRRWCKYNGNIKEMCKVKVLERMDWIDLAQVTDTWLVVVYTVMNFRVANSRGKFFEYPRNC